MSKPSRDDLLIREALVAMRDRRDSERFCSLVWKLEGIEADRAFVAFDRDETRRTEARSCNASQAKLARLPLHG